MALSDDVGDDYRRSLEAQRDDLARRLMNADNKDAAPLHRQLTVVLDKIDKLPTAEKGSRLDEIEGAVSDELAARRKGGRPAAKGKSRSRGRRSSGS